MDIEDRSFVFWDVPKQEKIKSLPFPFPESFTPLYCSYLGEWSFGMCDNQHAYIINLENSEYSVCNEEIQGTDPRKTGEQVSYFWKLADLGDGLFASLPQEETGDDTFIHIWDITRQTMIASIPVGCGGANDIRREKNKLFINENDNYLPTITKLVNL